MGFRHPILMINNERVPLSCYLYDEGFAQVGPWTMQMVSWFGRVFGEETSREYDHACQRLRKFLGGV